MAVDEQQSGRCNAQGRDGTESEVALPVQQLNAANRQVSLAGRETQAALPIHQVKAVTRQVLLALDAQASRINARAQEAKHILKECEAERSTLDAKRHLIHQAEKLQIELLSDADAIATTPNQPTLVPGPEISLTNEDSLDFASIAETPKRSFPAALFPSRVKVS